MTRAIAQYDRLAGSYDRRWQRYLEETVSRAIRYVEGAAPARVLDVACGTGASIAPLRAAFPQAAIAGVDGSARMLEQARAKFRSADGVTLSQGMAHALPFPSSAFDWVICLNAFHYFPRPTASLQEMRRVLKPGGRLLLLDWCRDAWHCRILNRWLQLTDPGHVWMYTQRESRRLLEAAQLTVERTDRFRVPWHFGWRVWEMMACVARVRASGRGGVRQ